MPVSSLSVFFVYNLFKCDTQWKQLHYPHLTDEELTLRSQSESTDEGLQIRSLSPNTMSLVLNHIAFRFFLSATSLSGDQSQRLRNDGLPPLLGDAV